MKNSEKAFICTLLLIGLVWLKSSLEKLTGGQFINSLGKILTTTAQKNPHPWFKAFLLNMAIPNSQVFAALTMYGEFLTALSITFSCLYIIFSKSKKQIAYYLLIVGLVGGMFLNLNFWLGFGYTSPSTDTLNMLMFLVELIGAATLFSSRKQHN